MKPLLILSALLAALWAYQHRPVPVDRSWWYEVPAREWRVEHGDIRIACGPVGCEGTRKNGEGVRL